MSCRAGGKKLRDHRGFDQVLILAEGDHVGENGFGAGWGKVVESGSAQARLGRALARARPPLPHK